MKKNIVLIVLLFLVRFFLYAGIESHPSLIINSGDEKAILKKLNTSKSLNNLHKVIISESDRLLSVPCLKYEKEGRRLLAVSREGLRRLFYLAYSYRMTNDEKYAKRAENEMLAVCSFADWNPTHFLDVAEMTMAVSIGYDWTYDYLSPLSRSVISQAILSHGLLPSLDTKYNGWLSIKNNWNQVCNSGMLFGAIAIHDIEPELSKTIIDRSLKSVLLPMSEYEPDGTYPEGFNYWNYGTSFNVMLITAAEKFYRQELFPDNKMPGFIKSASYILNMEGPNGDVFNYSDGRKSPEPNSTIYWFANRTKNASLLWNEGQKSSNLNLKSDRLLPAAVIWGTGIESETLFAPENLFWIGQGINPVCLMRSSWTDKNAIYLAFKAGSPSASHGHMDVGSFILEANGERWATDFGMQEYESLESKGVDVWSMGQKAQRWSIFRYNNLAHNTLAFNDSLQVVIGKCKIEKWSDKPEKMFATSDITPVYKGQAKKVIRTVSLINKSYVSIKDEIETLPVGTKVRWTLLTEAQPVLNLKNNTIELTKGGKKLHIKIKSSQKVVLKTWSTQSANSFDAPNPGTSLVGFEVLFPKNSKSLLNVLLVPEKKMSSIIIAHKTR